MKACPKHTKTLKGIVLLKCLTLFSMCFSEGNSRSKVIFTYTAMHGVGYKFIVEAFKMFAFKSNFVPVKEQVGHVNIINM